MFYLTVLLFTMAASDPVTMHSVVQTYETRDACDAAGKAIVGIGNGAITETVDGEDKPIVDARYVCTSKR